MKWMDVNLSSPERFVQVQVKYIEIPDVLADWKDSNGCWVIADIYKLTPSMWLDESQSDE